MPTPFDYVDVATRLDLAFKQYPNLRIQELPPRVVDAGGSLFVEVAVTIWRDLDDTKPCVAHAWEPFPGRTGFVKDSEMMNASTSAVGRALGLMGFGAKKSIASADEVNVAKARKPERQLSPGEQQQRNKDETFKLQQAAYERQRAANTATEGERATGAGAPTDKQLRYAKALIRGAGRPEEDFDLATFDGCRAAIEELKAAAQAAEEPF